MRNIVSRVCELAVMMMITGLAMALGEDTEEPREYCSFENFNASCGANHVILLTSARYGRMRIGRCVTENLGKLGCAADVLSILDNKCTGRRACDISVLDPELRRVKPCSNEVTWHLEVAYKCIPVIAPNGFGQCKPTKLNSTHYLSSVVAMDTGHGINTCPWKLSVQPGQTISVSVYDTFSSHKFDTDTEICYTLGIVTENGKKNRLTVCPQDIRLSRIVQPFTSKTNAIELVFSTWPANQPVPYLIQVDVVGCPEIAVPDHATARRSPNHVTVTCNDSEDERTWALVCKGNRWQGSLGNCTDGSKGPWAMEHMFRDGNILPMGILIAVALGVALGIFLGGLLLVIVGSRMKRRQRQRFAQTALVEPPEYDTRVETPQRFPSKSPGSATLSSSIEYTLSRGTDFTNENERQYTQRKIPMCPRDPNDPNRRCTSPYHPYETPSLT